MAEKKELPLALAQVLTKYTDPEHILSTSEIISILESEYNLSCERRTIYANIDLLKQYGYQISTWQENGIGYYLNEHQFTEKEIKVLCSALSDNNQLSSKEKKVLKGKLLATQSKWAENGVDRADNYIGCIPVSSAVRQEIETLMNKGQKIAAIKAVHNAANLGLAMSKSFIDHLPEINWKKCDLDTYTD